MPEGDTIHRTAATLERVLGGKVVRKLTSTVPSIAGAGLEGRRVERVVARGKSLLIHFDDGRAIHSHMRMTGSWHVYRPGERWRKAPHRARLVLETDELTAVCFAAPVLEVLRAGDEARHPTLATQGPDLLEDEFDAADARRRLRARGAVPIGEAIVDQRAIAGIGNIYKSESLFLCKLDPFTRVEQLADADLDRLVDQARALMRANTGHPSRAARRAPGGGMWAYGRSGERCYVCGDSIRMRRQGLAGRSTYFCPTCQLKAD